MCVCVGGGGGRGVHVCVHDVQVCANKIIHCITIPLFSFFVCVCVHGTIHTCTNKIIHSITTSRNTQCQQRCEVSTCTYTACSIQSTLWII